MKVIGVSVKLCRVTKVFVAELAVGQPLQANMLINKQKQNKEGSQFWETKYYPMKVIGVSVELCRVAKVFVAELEVGQPLQAGMLLNKQLQKTKEGSQF
jgi:hypothetical protein